MYRAAVVIVLLSALLMGCSTISFKGPMEAFEDANRAYRNAISFSEYVVAATFLKNADEGKVEEQIEHLNQFRVTAYEPRMLNVVEEDVRIRQVVKISYFKKDSMVVTSIADDQMWEYDPEKNTWLLTTGFPQLK